MQIQNDLMSVFSNISFVGPLLNFGSRIPFLTITF